MITYLKLESYKLVVTHTHDRFAGEEHKEIYFFTIYLCRNCM